MEERMKEQKKERKKKQKKGKKHAMHRTAAQHTLADAQPVPRQQQSP